MGEAVRVVDGGWRAAVLLTEMAVVFVGRPHASCSCTVALAAGSARAPARATPPAVNCCTPHPCAYQITQISIAGKSGC